MNDTFSHAVYGIELTEDDQKTLDNCLIAVQEALFDDEDYDYEDNGFKAMLAYIKKTPKHADLLQRIQTALADVRSHYPPAQDADIFYTGPDHAGRGGVGEDTWLLGYGLLYFPNDKPIEPEFQAAADWHLWAT